MSQSGNSTPRSSLSCSAILEGMERNGLYLGLDQHGGLVDSARLGLEEDFRARLTSWFYAHPNSGSPSAENASREDAIKLQVDALVKKFDFTMRCKDDDRESMLRDMLDLARMMAGSGW